MEKPQARFGSGDVVQRTNQPEAVGIVRKARWDEQAEGWNYSVQFGAQLKVVPEESLQEVVPIASVWDALRERTFSGVRHFVFTLTLHRLRRPPTRIAYSFATSRTQFYPHQFKPLLKFLDHPGKRLLIADDVGLGKTIEAGYILRELEAHQVVERVLVMVPARLAPKWKRELQTRFEENFDIVRRADLVTLANRLRQGREPEPFRWIVSYESARPEEVRAALEETQPPIDVLIADEAHRMRNPESLQHKLGAVLSRSSDTVLFLSATPVQNKLEDLWHLLRLLSPEEFGDWVLFQSQIEANRPLLSAQRALARRPVSIAEARNRLGEFFRSQPGQHLRSTEIARSLEQRLASGRLDRRDVVELQADIARLSPTGHILSRTRKIEAMPNRPVRAAGWRPVALTPEERRIYDNVEHLCRLTWPGEDSWGFQMSLLMAYRITASCIPAAIQYFAEKLGTSPSALPLAELVEEGDEADDDAQRIADVTAWSGPARARLAEAVTSYERIAGTDSKLDCLIEALRSIWHEDAEVNRPRRKVVVFSFFRRTLEHLARELQEREIKNRMIHGGIPVDDREVAIDDFLERSDVLVLLTSEVGGEGIDLQRASVLINYDLPWNPMVVEQRIGRIDRIGQEAQRIVILNLVVTESVEERVLQRLLDKIGIFRESVGELDPIIGDEIERLTTQALRGQLTEEELGRVVDERGDALARQVLEAREMLSRVDGLLAADQGLIDEINAVTGERQIPSEAELLLFLNAFLAERVPGCQLPRESVREVVSVDLRGALAAAMERDAPGLGPDVGAFARRIMGGPIALTLSREAAYRHPRAELIHLRHPLTRYAVSQVERAKDRPKTAFAVRLERSSILKEGIYGFLISLVELKGHRPTIRFAAAVGTLPPLEGVWSDPDETTPIILELLERGEDVEPPHVDAAMLDRLQDRLVAAVARLTVEWNSREQRLDLARRQQQHATLKATLTLRVQRARERLDALTTRGAGEFSIRMAGARLDKAERELMAVTSAPLSAVWEGIEQEEIAVGLLLVGGR